MTSQGYASTAPGARHVAALHSGIAPERLALRIAEHRRELRFNLRIQPHRHVRDADTPVRTVDEFSTREHLLCTVLRGPRNRGNSNPTLVRNIVCSRAIVDSLRTRSTSRQPRYVTLRCLRRCSFRAQLIDRTGCGLTRPLGETSGLDRTQNTHMALMPDGSGYESRSSWTNDHRESSHEQRTRTSKRA